MHSQSPSRLRIDEEAALRRKILRRLGRVLRGLARVGEPAVDTTASIPAESWWDDEFFYLEAELPSAAGGSIDVSIQGRKLFVRMAR